MARSYRLSAIRGQRATGGDYWSQPTPFQGGDVSTGAVLAKIGHSLIAGRRARSAMAELDRQARVQEDYTRAQIENLRSESQARLTPKPTMDLTIPGQSQGELVGPPQNEIVRGLTPNEYATQRRAYYPEPKPTPEITPYQERSLAQRDRALGIAQERADRATKATQNFHAAQSELTNITADEARREAEIRNIAANEATIYKQRALAGDNNIRKPALAALGADPEIGLKDADYQKYVDGFANDYVKRRTANAMWRVRELNKPRRQKAEAVTQEAAGVLQPQSEQQFLDQYRQIMQQPDEEQP